MANAAPDITGAIHFYGGANLNAPLATASAFTNFYGPTLSDPPLVLGGSQTGTFSGVPDNTPTTFNVFTFSPVPPAPFTLWSFNVGPAAYSFDVTSMAIVLQTPSFLNLNGSGIVRITGYADTAATWSITGTGFNQVMSFNPAITAIPEPSMSLMMLLVLSVVWFLRSGIHSRSGAKESATASA